MASLKQTLQVFRASLSSGQEAGIGDADRAIWAYLAPIQGLHAQVEALDALIGEVEALKDGSPFAVSLSDDL